MSEKISGIAASAGIAIAKAFVLQNPELTIERKSISDSASEIDRFEAALEEAAPTRAEHAFYRPQRLLLHTQHASPHTIFNATII